MQEPALRLEELIRSSSRRLDDAARRLARFDKVLEEIRAFLRRTGHLD